MFAIRWQFCHTCFEIRIQCRAHSRFHSVRLTRHGPLPLRSSLRLLNVRQVIYTRGFTARKILRKALTSIETGVARRDSVPRWDARLLRTKNHFLRPATRATNYKRDDQWCRTVGAMRLSGRDFNVLSALRPTMTETLRSKKKKCEYYKRCCYNFYSNWRRLFGNITDIHVIRILTVKKHNNVISNKIYKIFQNYSNSWFLIFTLYFSKIFASSLHRDLCRQVRKNTSVCVGRSTLPGAEINDRAPPMFSNKFKYLIHFFLN